MFWVVCRNSVCSGCDSPLCGADKDYNTCQLSHSSAPAIGCTVKAPHPQGTVSWPHSAQPHRRCVTPRRPKRKGVTVQGFDRGNKSTSVRGWCPDYCALLLVAGGCLTYIEINFYKSRWEKYCPHCLRYASVCVATDITGCFPCR